MSISTPQELKTLTERDKLELKLSDPSVVSSLSQLIDQAGLLAFLLQMLDGFLVRGDVIADSISQMAVEAREQTNNVFGDDAANLQQIVTVLSRLGVSFAKAAPDIVTLFDSGLFRSDVVQLLSTAADAAVEARVKVANKHPRIKSAFSLMKSLKDPDVQKGMSYVVELAASLGRRV